MESKEKPRDRLLRPKEVMVRLGVSQAMVYKLIENRTLPVVRLGTAVRVPERKLEEWIERKTENAT